MTKKRRMTSLPKWFDGAKYDICDDFDREEWRAALSIRRAFYFSVDNNLTYQGVGKDSLQAAKARFLYELSIDPINPDLRPIKIRFGYIQLRNHSNLLEKYPQIAQQARKAIGPTKDEVSKHKADSDSQSDNTNCVHTDRQTMDSVSVNSETVAENIQTKIGKDDDRFKSVTRMIDDYLAEKNDGILFGSLRSPPVGELKVLDAKLLASMTSDAKTEDMGKTVYEYVVDSGQFDHFEDEFDSSSIDGQESSKIFYISASLEATDEALKKAFSDLISSLRKTHNISEPRKKPTERIIEKLTENKVLAVLDIMSWADFHNLQLNYDILNKEIFDFKLSARIVQDRVVKLAKSSLTKGFLQSLAQE